MADTDEYVGWHFEWIEQWSQFFEPCNWYTFHPMMLEFEDERNMGGLEMTLVVLGLGFRARYNYTITEAVENIQQQVTDLEKRLDL